MTRKRCTGLDSKQWGFSVDFGEEDTPPGRDPKLRETLIKSSLSTGSITRQTHRITGQLRERGFLRWRSRPFAPDHTQEQKTARQRSYHPLFRGPVAAPYYVR